MKVTAIEIQKNLELIGFNLEIDYFPENACKAEIVGNLLPLEKILLRQYLLEGNQSVKNFLDYSIQKRLPELVELGWRLSGDKIIAPNNPACPDCPGRMKCFFG